MNNGSSLSAWERIVSALEEQVACLADAEVMASDGDGHRVATLRAQVAAAVRSAEIADASVKARRIPTESRAQRDALRYLLARKRTSHAVMAMTYSAPDQMSDAEVESMLRELLTNELLDK